MIKQDKHDDDEEDFKMIEARQRRLESIHAQVGVIQTGKGG